jgi:hypothetical protein
MNMPDDPRIHQATPAVETLFAGALISAPRQEGATCRSYWSAPAKSPYPYPATLPGRPGGPDGSRPWT